ncbi:MAG: BrnT family toxin [Actinomycetota bacterium]
MQFEWDEEKAEANLKKHGVSFAEASTVFGDLSAKMFYDDEHSVDEIREFIVGYSEMNRLLVVNFTERGHKRIRIFTARKSTDIEREDYEENEQGRRR